MDDEENTTPGQLVKPRKVYIAAIHEKEGAGLWNERVEDIDLVQFVLGHMDKRRDIAAQIEQGMEFGRCLGLAEVRPREQRQTEIDRGGNKGVDGIAELKPEDRVDKGDERCKSDAEQNRHKCANPGARWLRPTCCVR